MRMESHQVPGYGKRCVSWVKRRIWKEREPGRFWNTWWMGTSKNKPGYRWIWMWGLLVAFSLNASAQYTYGTTGLLHAPSADMQKDATVMAGGGYLHPSATPSTRDYHTWNYYVNITFFPWLEIGYTCTLFSEEWLGVDKHGYSGFTNQDRSFQGRLRIWKEGWWKD